MQKSKDLVLVLYTMKRGVTVRINWCPPASDRVKKIHVAKIHCFHWL